MINPYKKLHFHLDRLPFPEYHRVWCMNHHSIENDAAGGEKCASRFLSTRHAKEFDFLIFHSRFENKENSKSE